MIADLQRRSLWLASWLLVACAKPPLAVVRSPDADCRMPLQLREKRIKGRLKAGFAHVPPLPPQEYQQMRQLTDCYGAAVLGGSDGCVAEWALARSSGAAERYRIRSGEYDIPELLGRAEALPLGPARTHLLLVALGTANETVTEVAAYLWKQLTPKQAAALTEGSVFLYPPPEVTNVNYDPPALGLVASDIEEAIVCDSADLAAGRHLGIAFDPKAPIPNGP